jgi:hypothetical protein
MTTPRDLLFVTFDMDSVRPVERGDLSLGLAAAELIDLLAAGAVAVDGDRVVPGQRLALHDALLDEAVSSLDREPPYEPVGEWLWRRGRDLSAHYLDVFSAEGQLTREEGRRWVVLKSSRTELVDTPARRRAAERWRADEPVLATLAAAVGIRDKRTGDSPVVADDAVVTVLNAVDDALAELAAERHQRARRQEQAAADNRWRGY